MPIVFRIFSVIKRNVASDTAASTTSRTLRKKAVSSARSVSSLNTRTDSSPDSRTRPTWVLRSARSEAIRPFWQTSRNTKGCTDSVPCPTSELLITTPAWTTSPGAISLRLLGAHALKVGVGNLQLVGQLAPRKFGDAVSLHTRLLVDVDRRDALLAGAVAHERRGHHHVLLGRELALEFLGEINEGTSTFHGETPNRKAETARPETGSRTSPLG